MLATFPLSLKTSAKMVLLSKGLFFFCKHKMLCRSDSSKLYQQLHFLCALCQGSETS